MNKDSIKLLERGFASQQRGDLRAAKKAYANVLKRDADNEFALNLMGVVCIRDGRFADAIDYLRRALRVNSGDAETYNNLGLAYVRQNMLSEAQAAFERSLELNDRQPATLNNLGNVFAATDQHETAIRCFEAALLLDRDFVDCLDNLAASLKEVGRVDDAKSVLHHALRIDGNRSESHNRLGEVLLSTTQYEDALAAFSKAIQIDDSIVARINASTALKQLGNQDGALKMLNEVISAEGDNAEALNHMGVLQEQIGNMEMAAAYFRRAIASVPNHASSWYQLSKLKEQRLSDQEITAIRAMIDAPGTLDIFRSSLLLALACEFEKRKEYAASIEYFAAAQRLRALRHPYDQCAVISHVQAMKKCFPLARIAVAGDEEQWPIPVFIVGMPRSGTTLTEQIITSHSDIAGAGEVGFINDLVRDATQLTGERFPEALARLTAQQAQELRSSYFRRIVGRCGAAPLVVDKNPLNYNLIGVIATLFPDARIIYCKRDAMDNCVSIFRLPFDTNQGYAHSLPALGHYYRQHEELMDFWLDVYRRQILQVDYEETVADLEAQARRMLDFLGVDFEPGVLRFHANQRLVLTPSAEQVRQPIYKSSVGSWRRYGDALQPLAAALGAGHGDQS